MDCYYVPFYLRDGEAAPAEARDAAFAAQVEQATPVSCSVLTTTSTPIGCLPIRPTSIRPARAYTQKLCFSC